MTWTFSGLHDNAHDEMNGPEQDCLTGAIFWHQHLPSSCRRSGDVPDLPGSARVASIEMPADGTHP